mgnify:CR=1 FL=1
MPLPKDKKKFALWLHPQTLEEISEAYASDNCRSKSEFIEKAVKFYLAHLDAQNESSVLPNVFLSAMKGMLSESDNRISRLLFKIAVELAMTMNVAAASCNITRRKRACMSTSSRARTRRIRASWSRTSACWCSRFAATGRLSSG